MCQVNPGPTARASGSVNPRGENPPSLGKGRAAFYNIRVKGKARKSTQTGDGGGRNGGHPPACTSLPGASRGLGPPGQPVQGQVRVQSPF